MLTSLSSYRRAWASHWNGTHEVRAWSGSGTPQEPHAITLGQGADCAVLAVEKMGPSRALRQECGRPLQANGTAVGAAQQTLIRIWDLPIQSTVGQPLMTTPVPPILLGIQQSPSTMMPSLEQLRPDDGHRAHVPHDALGQPSCRPGLLHYLQAMAERTDAMGEPQNWQ